MCSTHIYIYMVVFCIGFPLATAIYFTIKRKTLLELEMLEKFGPFYSSVEDFFFLWTDGWLAILFFLVLILVFTPKIAQFILTSATLIAMFYVVAIFLPLTQLWKNAVVAGGIAFAVLVQILSLATSYHLFHSMKIYGSVIAFVLIPLLITIAVVVRAVGIVKVKVQAKRGGKDGAIKGYFMREIRRKASANL